MSRLQQLEVLFRRIINETNVSRAEAQQTPIYLVHQVNSEQLLDHYNDDVHAYSAAFLVGANAGFNSQAQLYNPASSTVDIQVVRYHVQIEAAENATHNIGITKTEITNATAGITATVGGDRDTRPLGPLGSTAQIGHMNINNTVAVPGRLDIDMCQAEGVGILVNTDSDQEVILAPGWGLIFIATIVNTNLRCSVNWFEWPRSIR